MIRTLLLILSTAFISCNNPISESDTTASKTSQKTGSFAKNLVHDLPTELSEISGITFLNDSVLVAIQDEEGILFHYNLNQKRIIKKQWFAGEGDYEDVAQAGNDIYVITSVGLLYEIKDFQSPKPLIRSYETPLSNKNDVEGLAYDRRSKRLLIAPKEDGLDNDKTTKEIYGFDLNTMTFQPEPAFTIHLKDIEARFEGGALMESSKRFLKALGNQNMNKVFRSSALTVHEESGEVYILSSINGILLNLDLSGGIERIIQFSGPEFKQPEGLAFSPNGKLYISNEGNKSGIGNITEIIYEK